MVKQANQDIYNQVCFKYYHGEEMHNYQNQINYGVIVSIIVIKKDKI
jgi:hypothetical protein